MKAKIVINKALGIYDVIPLEGEKQGRSAATVEAIVLNNVESNDGCPSGEVVAVWGAVLAPDIDNDTSIGLVMGVQWPESNTPGMQEFYAVDEMEVAR